MTSGIHAGLCGIKRIEIFQSENKITMIIDKNHEIVFSRSEIVSTFR